MATTMHDDETTPTCATCERVCEGGWVDTLDPTTGRTLRTVCARCDRDARFDEYVRTGRLSTWLVDEVAMRHYYLTEGPAARRSKVERPALVREIHAKVEALHGEVERFGREVWFGGLQAFVRGQRVKGGRAATPIESGIGSIGAVKLLTYAMCGRAMITLEAASCSVTLITDETSADARMGLRGIDATADEARALLGAVRAEWAHAPVAMVDDTDVGLAL